MITSNARLQLENAYANSREYFWEAFVVWMYLDDPLSWLIRIGQFLLALGWSKPTHCAVLYQKIDDEGNKAGESFTVEITRDSVEVIHNELNVNDLWKISPDVDFIGIFEDDTIQEVLGEVRNLGFYSNTKEILWYFLKLRWHQFLGYLVVYDSEQVSKVLSKEQTVSPVFTFIPPVTCTFPIWRPMIIELSKDKSGVPQLIPTASTPAACKTHVTRD